MCSIIASLSGMLPQDLAGAVAQGRAACCQVYTKLPIVSGLSRRAGGFFQVAKNSCQGIASKVHESHLGRMYRSMLAGVLWDCIKENTIECAGYYGAGALAAPLGAMAGRKVAEVAAQVLINLNGTGAEALSCSDLEAYGQLGEAIGEQVAYYSAAFVAAYGCIKALGSQEVFYDRERFAASYPIKTAQSMLICAMLDQQGLIPGNQILNLAVGQFLGSIFYHPIDYVPFVKKWIDARGLEGAGPIDLPLLSRDHLRAASQAVQCQVASRLSKPFSSLIKLQRVADLTLAHPGSLGICNRQVSLAVQKSVAMVHQLIREKPHLMHAVDQAEKWNRHVIISTDRRLSSEAMTCLVDPLGDFIDPSLKKLSYIDLSSQLNLDQLAQETFDQLVALERAACGLALIPKSEVAQSVAQIRYLMKWVARLTPLAWALAQRESEEEITRNFFSAALSFGTQYYTKTFGRFVCQTINSIGQHQLR